MADLYPSSEYHLRLSTVTPDDDNSLHKDEEIIITYVMMQYLPKIAVQLEHALYNSSTPIEPVPYGDDEIILIDHHNELIRFTIRRKDDNETMNTTRFYITKEEAIDLIKKIYEVYDEECDIF